MVNYSTRISAKWGVYLLRRSFDLENGMFWPSWPTLSIAKKNLRRNPRTKKKMVNYSTRKSAKWEVYLMWGSFDL
ncbi:hypothetical protein H5410_031958 [Solanum commersonii]|uniref:Uncharacterized protein n=1 Tax=Solanum commersonii TaxID=4109 RepID=A0A9J5YN85_SOLCO|nr:hypothetical protein H5410_031958 [Solanum commersonii]